MITSCGTRAVWSRVGRSPRIAGNSELAKKCYPEGTLGKTVSEHALWHAAAASDVAAREHRRAAVVGAGVPGRRTSSRPVRPGLRCVAVRLGRVVQPPPG